MHRTIIAVTLTGVIVLGPASAVAQQSDRSRDATPLATRCGPADVRGSYGFFRTGVNAQGSIAAVGVGFFDGNGNMTTSQSTNRNGTITQGSFPGTYDVVDDCRGVWYDASGAVTAHFVLLDGGNEFFFLSTSAGNIITGHGKRIAPR